LNLRPLRPELGAPGLINVISGGMPLPLNGDRHPAVLRLLYFAAVRLGTTTSGHADERSC
jgi:hypothetical protein